MKVRYMVEIETDLALVFPEVSDAEVLDAAEGLTGPEALKEQAEALRQDLEEHGDPEGSLSVRFLSGVLV